MAEGRDMTETLQLRGRFAGIDLDELVDAEVVRTWLYWGMFWLMVTPTVGVTISALFNYPDYLGTTQREKLHFLSLLSYRPSLRR